MGKQTSNIWERFEIVSGHPSFKSSLFPPPHPSLLFFPPAAHPGNLQEAVPCLPNLSPVQLWERVDAASQDGHRGPDPQRLRHWRLQEPILCWCSGLDVHLLLHPRPGLLYPAPSAQQVSHAQNQVRQTKGQRRKQITVCTECSTGISYSFLLFFLSMCAQNVFWWPKKKNSSKKKKYLHMYIFSGLCSFFLRIEIQKLQSWRLKEKTIKVSHINFNYFSLCSHLICRRKTIPLVDHENEDEDVANEHLRVASGAASSDILQVNQLTKVYQHLKKKVYAVKRLSVGIPAGEVSFYQ